MRQGKRGPGRRRLRELTRGAVEAMEILEEVREEQPGVGGMSKALTRVIKLGLKTCLLEPEERGRLSTTTSSNSSGSRKSNNIASGSSGSSTCSYCGSAFAPPVFLAASPTSVAESGGKKASVSPIGRRRSKYLRTPPSAGAAAARTAAAGSSGAGASGGATAALARKSRANSTIFLESGAGGRAASGGGGGGGGGGSGEEPLPRGVAYVLWELECCVEQAHVTLMSLNEGRPNHFGVFRACVYVEEMRMLEAKILELVEQAADPPEERNARLETTVAAGIRNCVARLWWCRRAGEDTESVTWDAFEGSFQLDFGAQLPTTMEVFRNHIAVLEDDDCLSIAPPPQQPPPPPPPPSLQPTPVTAAAAAAASNSSSVAAALAPPAFSFSAAAAAIEARVTAALDPNSPGGSVHHHAGAYAAGFAAATAATAAAGAGGSGTGAGGAGGGTHPRRSVEVVVDAETGQEERQQQEEATGSAAAAAVAPAAAFERGVTRFLSSVRQEREGVEAGSGCGRGRGAAAGNCNDGRRRVGRGSGRSRADHSSSTSGGSSSSCNGSSSNSTWRVPAWLFEAVTWTHGGLYEAFQALTDPRRVVFALGVVDDGPHIEGDGGEGREGGRGGSVASPVVVQGLLGLSVQQVCCGGQHAAVLTDCGEIFTWGRGGFGRLGHGNREVADSPKRIKALEGIPCVQVACGFAYTAAVTAAGDLYTWGAGENGRLGLGDVEDRHTPSRVEGLHSKVKEVYAGSVHSCVLTREGTVYAFGKHEYTGHGATEDVLEPRLIPTFSAGSGGGDSGGTEESSEGPALGVRQISVGPGGYHTLALTCQGHVYAWGHNRVAQLGIGNSFTVPRNTEGAYFLPRPQLVESLVGMNVVKVVAGWGHSAALTVNGQLYVCGRNYQGQLGLGSPQGFPLNERGHPFQAEFCLIDRLQHLKIRQIACGGEHSVAVAENGEVWSFGSGQKGQLGHESTDREDFPRLVQALKRTRRKIMHVACGNNCTLVLAGEVAFPSLFEMTAEVIRRNPKLCADVESLGLLPPTVVDSLSRTASD